MRERYGFGVIWIISHISLDWHAFFHFFLMFESVLMTCIKLPPLALVVRITTRS